MYSRWTPIGLIATPGGEQLSTSEACSAARENRGIIPDQGPVFILRGKTVPRFSEAREPVKPRPGVLNADSGRIEWTDLSGVIAGLVPDKPGYSFSCSRRICKKDAGMISWRGAFDFVGTT
jgi:hypothetical protein